MSTEGITGSGQTQETQSAQEAQKHTEKGSNPARMSSSIGDMAKFKEKNPEMYDKMMMAIGTDMANKWRKFPERLKQIRLESERR